MQFGTYAPAGNLNILAPSVMVEHYEGQSGVIDCLAEYRNFLRFEVEVKFDVAPSKPPGI
jgi:hypothetical protein